MKKDKEPMIDFELMLPYYKQGDDLARCQNQTTSHAAALKLHAESLEDAAKTLRRLAGLAAEGELKIVNADTHCIQVACRKSIGEVLVKEKVLSEQSDEGDDEMESPQG